MQFIIYGGRLILKPAIQVTKNQILPLGYGSLKLGTRASLDFGRGAAGLAPKAYPLVRSLGSTTSTVSASYRSGQQIRLLTLGSAKLAFLKAPITTYTAAKYAVRSTIRDAMSPYHATLQLVKGAAAEAQNHGRFPNFVRRVGQYDDAARKVLLPLGLHTSNLGLAATAARLGVVGTGLAGFSVLRDRIEAADRYLQASIANYQAIKNKVVLQLGTPTPAPAPPAAAPLPVPAPAPQTAPQPAIPLAPPLQSQRGGLRFLPLSSTRR